MPRELFGMTLSPIEIAQVSSPGVLNVIEGYQPADVVKEAIVWGIIFAIILCVVFIFIGGISFILSGGQDEKIKQAVSTIRYAIIGLVIVILSVTLVNLITFIFQVPFDFVDYGEIFDRIRDISQFFSGGGNSFDSF